jgi:hypothetical protein
VLADKLQFPKIPEWQIKHNDLGISYELQQISDKISRLHKENSLESFFKDWGIESYNRWLVSLEWRGFSGSILHDIGGYLAFFKHTKTEETHSIVFPIYVHGVLQGAIKGLLNKPIKGPAYINSKGGWAKQYGLFPYDYVYKKLLTRAEPVYLVEGPRDAIRFINEGQLALAVLGSSNLSYEKTILLTHLNTTKLVVVPDNDEAGEKMIFQSKLLFSKINTPFEVEYIVLPKTIGGKPAKIDPCSMSDKLYKRLISM